VTLWLLTKSITDIQFKEVFDRESVHPIFIPVLKFHFRAKALATVSESNCMQLARVTSQTTLQALRKEADQASLSGTGCLICLTSSRAVDVLENALLLVGEDSKREVLQWDICTIRSTQHAALKTAGFVNCYGGNCTNASELADLIVQKCGERRPRVLFLHGSIALDTLPRSLQLHSFEVHRIMAYETVKLPVKDVEIHARDECLSLQKHALPPVRAIVAFSPSGVPSVQQISLACWPSAHCIALGKSTASAMKQVGFPAAAAIALVPSPAGVLDAIARATLEPARQAAGAAAL
jgi:uroporphyrinogen-III synthase